MTTVRERASTRTPRMRTRELVGVIAGSALWVVIVWWMSSAAGAVGIARADDWSYLLTQFDFADTGKIVLNNWAVTFLLGQTVLAAPLVLLFGAQIWILQLFIAVLSACALIATYAVVRRYLTRLQSFLAVALLAVSPIFGPSVVSFMTDLPALLFLSLSLLCGAVALDARSTRTTWLVGSALLGLVAFTFRDYAIVGCLVVLAIAAVRTGADARARSLAISLFLGVGAVSGALYFWRHSLPNDLDLAGWSLGYSVTLTARALLTLALLVLPALLAFSPRGLWNALSKPRVVVVTTGVLVAVGVAVLARGELLGNVIHPYGGTWLLSGSGVRMWPLMVNRLIIISAVVALAIALTAAFALLRRAPTRSAGRSIWTDLSHEANHSGGRLAIVLFPFALVAVHTGATLLLGTWWIDRYFLLVLPFLAAAILIIGGAGGLLGGVGSRWAGGLGLVCIGIMGVHVTDFDARFDGARWAMGEGLVQQGYASETVDAGMQWVSFHAREVGLGAQNVPTRPGRNWWTERYPGQQVCATVWAVDDPSQAPGQALDVQVFTTLLGRHFTLYSVVGPDSCPD